MNDFKNIPTDWDLSMYFKSDNDKNIEKESRLLEQRINRFSKKWSERNDYMQNAEMLKEALDEYEKLQAAGFTYGKVGYYLWLRRSQDSQDEGLKKKFNKFDNLEKNLLNKILFFELNLGKIPTAKQKMFLDDPQLQPYAYFLKKIFISAKHDLNEGEERIINLKSGPAYSEWVNMLEEFISSEERTVLQENGKKTKASFEQIMNLISSRNKKVRDFAAEELNLILEKYARVAEHEINAIYNDKKINDHLRGYARPESSRFIKDEISPGTVDMLTGLISDNFNISVRYYRLKAKLMKTKRLDYHERNVEIGSINKKYTLAQAYKLISRTFYGLDEDFGMIFDRLVEEGRIDAYPKKGKRTGAFASYTAFGATYIMLNFTKKMRDLTTIAHESGHAINGELMRYKENALNYGGTLATAEVASTFMEDYVLKEILKNADDEARLSIMMMRLNDDVSTIFRQIACHNFQQELHALFRQEGYVSRKTIGDIFSKHMKAYMGPAVEQSPGSQNWWVYWGHIRSFFYNYQYASGLLIGKSMQQSYAKDPKFMGKIKQFLSTGSSASFEDIFKSIGINVKKPDFWQQGLDEIDELLKETEKLAKQLGKI